jgi:hypothetical protein
VVHPEHILMDTIRGETPLCCTHDRLTELIRIGRHIACSVESLHARLLALIDDEAALRVFLWIHTVDDLRIWRRSDGDEYPIKRKSLVILELNPSDSHHTSFDRCDLSIVVEGDIRSFICLVDPDILCTRSITTDEDMHMCAEICEIECLSDGSIASSDDSHGESLIEVPITGRTVGYPLSVVFHFTRHSELFILISGGEDDTFRLIDVSFLSLYLEVIFANLRHHFDTILDKCRSSSFRMSQEAIHDLTSWCREYSWPVLDTVRSREGSPRKFTDDDIVDLIATCVHTSRESCRSCTDDDEVVFYRHNKKRKY